MFEASSFLPLQPQTLIWICVLSKQTIHHLSIQTPIMCPLVNDNYKPSIVLGAKPGWVSAAGTYAHTIKSEIDTTHTFSQA